MKSIPSNITDKIGKNLYTIQNHPIQIVKELVFAYFDDMVRIEIENPYIPIEYNYDKLRIPLNHPSRLSDPFYKDDKIMLRTHMTCYLYPFAFSKTGKSKLKFITCGDVYRQDIIDKLHYPVFHQIDAFHIVDENIDVKKDLRDKLNGLMNALFGSKYKFRIIEDTNSINFPFTEDSLEIEIEVPDINGNISYLEILGAGTVHPSLMKDLGLVNHKAWAFGIGVERIAMLLFDISDIRLFWSNNKIISNDYINYELVSKDLYINNVISYNDVCNMIRSIDINSIIESVIPHKESNNIINYKINYRAVDKVLKKVEINKIHNKIKKEFTNVR